MLERIARRIAIIALPFMGMGFLIFLGWAAKEVANQYGLVMFGLAVACSVVTFLGVASLFDERSGLYPPPERGQRREPLPPSQADPASRD